MMIIKELNFGRGWRETDPLKGTITFAHEAGEMKLVLTEAEVQEITKTCTQAMIRVSQDAFNRIGKAIEATAGLALPAPEAA